ncbi:MAG: dockerin type I domain-containing protein [Candidatus Sumerlaeota bacterium]|nr:dockerin type I domain-containing protein [Candidatus Sumerlaeota bacterium]
MRHKFIMKLGPFLLALMLSLTAQSFAQIRGDLNNDGRINQSDVTQMINLLIKSVGVPGLPDVNNDGRIDVSDLRCLVNALTGNIAWATFSDQVSSATEGVGTVYLPVLFSKPVKGFLRYRLADISTTQAVDLMGEASIAVNGISASIPLAITDDAEMKGARAVVVDLIPDLAAGYWVSGLPRHTLIVYDNDSLWTGVIKNGLTELAFRLKILQSPTSFSVSLISSLNPNSLIGVQGAGAIPEGEWRMTATLTTQTFQAESELMPMGTASFFDNNPINRTLSFNVAPSLVPYYMRPTFMLGQYTDRVLPVNSAAAFLQAETTGVVVLMQDLQFPSFPTTPLYPALSSRRTARGR